jgi:hypothetical protein
LDPVKEWRSIGRGVVLVEGRGAGKTFSGIGGRLGWCLIEFSYFVFDGESDTGTEEVGVCVPNGTLK